MEAVVLSCPADEMEVVQLVVDTLHNYVGEMGLVVEHIHCCDMKVEGLEEGRSHRFCAMAEDLEVEHNRWSVEKAEGREEGRIHRLCAMAEDLEVARTTPGRTDQFFSCSEMQHLRMSLRSCQDDHPSAT